MLTVLCRVLLSETGVSVEILTETVIAVAECIRGNYTNQEYFAGLSLATSENTQRYFYIIIFTFFFQTIVTSTSFLHDF